MGNAALQRSHLYITTPCLLFVEVHGSMWSKQRKSPIHADTFIIAMPWSCRIPARPVLPPDLRSSTRLHRGAGTTEPGGNRFVRRSATAQVVVVEVQGSLHGASAGPRAEENPRKRNDEATLFFAFYDPCK